MENRFFATVFLGSGLLFLAMLFTGSAVAGGIIVGAAFGREPSLAPLFAGRARSYRCVVKLGKTQ